MTRTEAVAYARRWADEWNARDIDAVLTHFAEDVIFSSPKALQVAGSPTVRGKASLAAYWWSALERIDVLRFSVERVIWDEGSSELSIIYDRDVNGQRDRAAEVLRFGVSG